MMKKNKGLRSTTYNLQPITWRAGFTLIELMIYMGLLSIFLFVLTDLLVSTLEIRTQSSGSSAVALDSAYSARRFEYDIHRSSAITSPATGASGNTLSLTIGGSSYTFASSSGSLTLTRNGVSESLTSDAVILTDFSVERIGNGNEHDTLRISTTLESREQLRGRAAEVRSQTFTIGAW